MTKVKDNEVHQANLWRLSSVCKAFHAVFRAHPDISNVVYVSNDMLTKAESSTVAWLQAQGPVVQFFCGPDDPAQTAKCLMALSGAVSALKSVFLHIHPTADGINSLCNFKALTTCSLTSSLRPGTPGLDLTPLQSLEKLETLTLEQGGFFNIQVARQLTCLGVGNAQVTGVECSFCSFLVNLSIDGSHLSSLDLHSNGLLACTALQSLELWGSCNMSASRYEDGFDTDDDMLRLPEQMSCLQLLVDLTLCIDHPGWQKAFSTICTLTNLQALRLVAAGTVEIGNTFKSLVKLRMLCVGSAQEGCLKLSLDWKALQALHSFAILCCSSFTCDVGILGLLELKHLSSLFVTDAPAADRSSADLMGTLKQRLLDAGKRVQVPDRCSSVYTRPT